MSDFEKVVTTIFGGILLLAVISVIVGRNSTAVAAIQAFGQALSSTVGAAVNPVSKSSTGASSSNGVNSFTSTMATFQNELDTLGPLGVL